MRAFLEYWLMVCQTRLRPITLVTYARDVRRLTAVLGDIPLRNALIRRSVRRSHVAEAGGSVSEAMHAVSRRLI